MKRLLAAAQEQSLEQGAAGGEYDDRFAERVAGFMAAS